MSQKLKNDTKISVCLNVLKFLVKTGEILFLLIAQEPFGLLKESLNAIFSFSVKLPQDALMFFVFCFCLFVLFYFILFVCLLFKQC